MGLVRLLLFFGLAVSSFGQLAPRVEIKVTASVSKDIADTKTLLDAKQLALNSGKTSPLDITRTVSTNKIDGKVESYGVNFFAAKAALLTAKEFIQTNNWPAGTIITVRHHLCPSSNALPAGWLGCTLDPRAEWAEVVLKP